MIKYFGHVNCIYCVCHRDIVPKNYVVSNKFYEHRTSPSSG
jgi:hypothetical protein